MGVSVTGGLILLSALVPTGLATTIPLPGASAAGESVATITASSTTTITNVVTSTSAVVTTGATCTPGTTALASNSQCSDYVWSSAGKYWRESCTDASISGGTTRAIMDIYGRQSNINGCHVYCSIFNNMCNAVNYVPALSTCYYLWATANAVVSASGYQALTSYTTNPCYGPITSIETDYSTQYLTSEVFTTYLVTLSSSAVSTADSSTPSPVFASSVMTPSPNPTTTVLPASSAPVFSSSIPSSSSIAIARSSSSRPPVASSSSARVSPVLSSSQPDTSSTPLIRSSSSSTVNRPSPASSQPVQSSSAISASASASASPSSPVQSQTSSSASAISYSRSARPSRIPSPGSSSSTVNTILPNPPSTIIEPFHPTSSTPSPNTPTILPADRYTTSTILTTRTATITACPSTIPDCPAHSKTTYLTTETVVVATTICPVTETQIPQNQSIPTAITSTAVGGDVGSESGEVETATSTVFSTLTITISGCDVQETGVSWI